MEQVQNYKYSVDYVGWIMLYLMTIRETFKYLWSFGSSFSTIHGSTWYFEHSKFTYNFNTTYPIKNMLNQAQKALQMTNPKYNLLFPDLFYYYDMKFVSLGYD